MEKKNIWKEIYAVLHDFCWILAAVTVLFVFLLRIVMVSGPSMTPTLLDGEYVALLNSPICGQYRQGDVVVATVPSFDPKQPIVKRVIATEGQTVDIDFGKGTVTVDGTVLDEPYINEPTYTDFAQGQTYPLTVPEGCVFLMGDNRNHSTDSRHTAIGCVDTDYILGKVILRVLPVNRISSIK